MAKPQNGLFSRFRGLYRTSLFLGALYLFVMEPVWNFLLSTFQAEATSGLHSLVFSEKIYHQSTSEWTEEFGDIGLGFDDDGKYVYFISPTEYEGRRLEELGLTLPVNFEALGAPVPGLTED